MLKKVKPTTRLKSATTRNRVTTRRLRNAALGSRYRAAQYRDRLGSCYWAVLVIGTNNCLVYNSLSGRLRPLERDLVRPNNEYDSITNQTEGVLLSGWAQ